MNSSSESAPQLPDTPSTPSKSQGPMAAKWSSPRSGYTPQGHNFNHRSEQCDSFRNRNGNGDGAYPRDNWSRHYDVRQNFIVPPPPTPPPYSLPPYFGGPFNGPREIDAYVPFIPPPYSVPPSPPPYSFPPHFGGPFNGLPETQAYVPFAPPNAHIDLELQIKIVNQIDYYFSFENLVKDIYLRQNMDKQGWVPVELIASFKRVMALTDNIYLILDAVRASSVVQVRGHNIRRRKGWSRWILPPSFHIPNNDVTKLAEKMKSISLESATNNGQDHAKYPKHLIYLENATNNGQDHENIQSISLETTTSNGQGHVQPADE